MGWKIKFHVHLPRLPSLPHIDPIKTIVHTIGTISDAATSVVNGIVNTITNVTNTVDGLISTAESIVDHVVDGIFTTVTGAVSDLGKRALATVADVIADVGHGLSTVADGIITTINTAENAFNSVVSVVGQLGQVVSDPVGFLKAYGHTIIDYVADTFCPGSSILIDVIWADIASGQLQLPTLQQLGQAAADYAAQEFLPGIDQALSDSLPSVVSHAVTHQLDNAVNTYIATGQLPPAQVLLDGVAQGIIDDATPQIEAVLKELLPGFAQGLQVVQSVAGTVTEIIDTAQQIEDMAQSELLALAGLGIHTLTSLEDVALDAKQALALIAAGVEIEAPIVKIVDTAANILTYSQAQMLALKQAGVDVLESTGAQSLIVSWQEMQEVLAAGLKVASTQGQIILDEPGAKIALLTDSFARDLANAGVQVIVADGAVTININQALDVERFDLILGRAGEVLNVIDTAANVMAMTTDEILNFGSHLIGAKFTVTEGVELSVFQALAFESAGIGIIRDSGSPIFGPEFDVAIVESGSVIQALTPEQLSGLAGVGVTALLDHHGSLTLNTFQAGALVTAGVRFGLDATAAAEGATFTVADSASSILAANAVTSVGGTSLADQLDTFHFPRWLVVDSVADLLGLTQVDASFIHDFLAGNGQVNLNGIHVTDTIENIASLTTAQIDQLAALGATAFVVSDSAANLLDFYLSGSQSPVPISEWKLADTAAILSSLTSSQIGDLALLGVLSLTSNVQSSGAGFQAQSAAADDVPVSIDLAQALALEQSGLSFAAGDDVVLTASAVGVEQLSAAQITALQGLGVTGIVISDGSIAIDIDQAAALAGASITLTVPDGDSVTVTLPFGSFPTFASPSPLLPLYPPGSVVQGPHQIVPPVIQVIGGSLTYSLAAGSGSAGGELASESIGGFTLAGGGSITASQIAAFQAIGSTASATIATNDLSSTFASVINAANAASGLTFSGTGSGKVSVDLYSSMTANGDPHLITISGLHAVQAGTWSFALSLSGLSDGLYTVVTNEFAGDGTLVVADVRQDALVIDRSAPTANNVKSLHFTSGAHTLITNSVLDFTDNVSAESQVTYSVAAPLTHGTILKGNAAVTSFTQADIDAGLIAYADNGSSGLADSLVFHVADAAGNQTTIQSIHLLSVMGTPDDDVLLATEDADQFVGLAGTDLASYVNAPSGVSANLHDPTNNTEWAADDTYDSIEGLIGSAFVDGLVGNDGNNLLQGGGGSDALVGGAGTDTFRFISLVDSTVALPDTISDFHHNEHDLIDLSAIDANSNKLGDQRFHLVDHRTSHQGHHKVVDFSESFQAYHHTHPKAKWAGAIRITKAGLIQGDVNGDGHADFSIAVPNSHLVASDFVF